MKLNATSSVDSVRDAHGDRRTETAVDAVSGARLVICLVLAGCGGARGPAVTCDRPVVLAGQDDVAAFAACTTVPALAIRTGGALDLAPLALATVTGDVAIGPTAGLDELRLPRLREVGGRLRIANNGLLVGAYFPALERAGRIEIDNNASLTTLSLPTLVAAGAFVLTDDASLEIVDAAQLASVRELVIANQPRLAVFDHAALAPATSRIERAPLLPPP